MKKIINGRRYDTDSAKRLASDYNTSDIRDFHWWKETLYRKSTGEYFLHGEGGPASKYAEPAGSSGWSSGERIMPLSPEEAQAWGEEHLDGDTYEKIFGIVEETTEKRTVTFSLPESTIELIKRNAARDNVTMSEYLAELVRTDKKG